MRVLQWPLNVFVVALCCGTVQSRPLAAFLGHAIASRGQRGLPFSQGVSKARSTKVQPIFMAQGYLRSLKKATRQEEDVASGLPSPSSIRKEDNSQNFRDDNDDDDESGNVHIPSAGISISDEMEAAQQDRFATTIVPFDEELMRPGVKVAQLLTNSLNSGSLEPIRYLVGLTPASSAITDAKTATNSFVLVDVPPYSPQLAAQIRTYLGTLSGSLIALVITSRDAIHYDSRTAYAIRKSDISSWKGEFPDMAVVSYRLDTPRDCRESVTQVLDGNGPFALDDNAMALNEPNATHKILMETGRPLSYEEWDFGTAQAVMSGKQLPPDDEERPPAIDQEDLYSPQAIRSREEGKSLLAVYTPGHSFGSMSYVFPRIGVCCSGYALPVEDNRMYNEDNMFGRVGSDATGPVLDCRGYVTTSRAGVSRQMESARRLVNDYIDRFHIVLPSRGDPCFLRGTTGTRQRQLLDILQQYEKIGKIYEELGITTSDDQ